MIQCGCCPYKKGSDTGTDTREKAVAAEAEVEFLQEQPRNMRSCPNHPKREEAEKMVLAGFRGSMTLPTRCLLTSGLHGCGAHSVSVVVKGTRLWHFAAAAIGNKCHSSEPPAQISPDSLRANTCYSCELYFRAMETQHASTLFS